MPPADAAQNPPLPPASASESGAADVASRLTGFPGVAAVPAGAWGVAVSGGLDSVALLRLARARQDLRLHVIHLDHQLRGPASDEDALFVERLAGQLGLPCTLARRGQVEMKFLQEGGTLPRNLSASLRALRLALYAQCVRDQGLQGVLLAHHSDDQAETIMLRILRGAGSIGLAGMATDTTIKGVRIVRPLLAHPKAQLRALLESLHQPWREDESNTSLRQARNRVRQAMAARPELAPPLLRLAQAMRALVRWSRQAAPRLGPAFSAAVLADLPMLLQRESARRWLQEQGLLSPSPAAIERLIVMASDFATPAAVDFAAALRIRRRHGFISAERR